MTVAMKTIESTFMGEVITLSQTLHHTLEYVKECLVRLAEATGHEDPVKLTMAVREFMAGSPGTGIAFQVNGKEKIFDELTIRSALALSLDCRKVFEYDTDHTCVVRIHIDRSVVEKVKA